MQQTLLKLPKKISNDVERAVKTLAFAPGENRGAVFTRPEVVKMVLDAAGYKTNEKLYEKTVLEPCFGGGDFLFTIIDRLLKNFYSHGYEPNDVARLKHSIVAVELHQPTYEETGRKIRDYLAQKGVSQRSANLLVNAWLKQGDFLLTDIEERFDYVVGNPPYLRQEAIPPELLNEYRSRFQTLYDRADLYVPFFERALHLLNKNGRLSFICSDRWMKNKYGGPLRKLIAEKFYFRAYINMFGYPAFHDEVSAYTAVTVISNEEPLQTTAVCFRPALDSAKIEYVEMRQFAANAEPWLLDESVPTHLLRRLESDLPTLEESGCKVGIGVATGNDSIYINELKKLPIEPSRKMPLVMRDDLSHGSVAWSGRAVINVFENDGGVVNLDKYPKLKKYFADNAFFVKKRNVAKRNRIHWYRTIDRIDSRLVAKHKLLIPDISDRPQIVHEKGEYYPHHNLYFVTSDVWDLDALKAIMMSDIARMFIRAYSVKMRGGYVRYQAQYLRRIRVPVWAKIPTRTKNQLQKAGRTGDQQKCNAAAARAYKLSASEMATLSI